MSLKAQELLCYLLLHRSRPHRRELLATLLWQDVLPAQSRKYLRQALWQLQTAVDAPGQASGERLVHVDSDWVLLNPEADIWLDVALFERAFQLVHGVPGHALDAHTAGAVQRATDLYQGDLLDGWYQDWCLIERSRLEEIYVGMLNKLMVYFEAKGDYESGFALGSRILSRDPACERTHWRLMRLHYLSGDRTAALRQYDRCLAALEKELGVQPSRPLTALYQQIRDDRCQETLTLKTEALRAGAASQSQLPEVLARLQQLWELLADVQRQIDEELQTVQLSLKREP